MTELPLSYLELLCCLGSQAARDALCEAEDVKAARFFIYPLPGDGGMDLPRMVAVEIKPDNKGRVMWCEGGKCKLMVRGV